MGYWDELNGEQSLPAEPNLWPDDRAPVQITVRPPRAAPPDEGVPGWATPARPPMSYEPQTDGMWQSLMAQGATPQPNLWPQPALPAEPYERSAFEAAALRNRAPYRNLPAPGSSNMEAVADALVPKEPWEYGLMAASPGLGLIGRGIATLPRAVRAGATMAGFALTPEEAQAASKRALLEKMLGRSEAAKGFDTSSPEAQRLLFGGVHGPDTPEANWMIRYAKDGTPQLVDISRAKGTGPSHHAFSDVRTGKSIDEMSFKTSGTPPPEGNVFDIADLQKQNAYIMPGVTDPTLGIKGGTLDEVGGRVFEKPVPLEGGRNYSAIQADTPVPGLPDAQRLFANQKGPVTGILKDARRVLERGGVPYFSTVRMATQSMSSSPQVAQSVYQSIKAMNPSEELAGIFDAAVMKELAGKVNKKAGPYPGVNSPDLEAWLNKVSGPYRDKFVSALDAKSVLKAGGPDIGEIRYANTDPRYRSTPTGGSGLFMGRIRPELGTAPSGHTGYPTAFLTGKGETGGLGGSVPFHTLQPDLWRHLMNKGGPKMGNLPAYYTMGQLPGGPLKAQKVTQEVVDNVSEFIRRNPKMWATLMGVGVGAGATAGGTSEAEAGPADIIRKGIKAATAALPMDEASRMTRSAEMGLTNDVFHATRNKFDEFRDPNIVSNYSTTDRSLGTHFAKDPEISNSFVVGRDDRYVGGKAAVEGGRVIPARIPPDEKMLQVPQPRYEHAKPDTPEWRAVQTDQRAVENLAAGIAYRKDPELLSSYLQDTRGLSKVRADAAAKDLAAGKTYKIDDREYTLEKLLDSFGGAPHGRKTHQAMVETARKELQAQGYEGLKYINTAPQEMANAKDPTSYIVFDPARARSRFAEFDPAKRESRNLLAGLAGLLGTGATATLPNMWGPTPKEVRQ